ncbi:hypothetical protein [Leptospira licerasiae]|uniref:hypothetical protein n=1 Tax=Leptospira licerasiae TaxID=447106 RepID=UPI003016673D
MVGKYKVLIKSIKNSFFLILATLITIILWANCFAVPTNERTACLYNLKSSGTALDVTDDSCNFVGVALAGYNSASTSQEQQNALLRVNFQLMQCLEYHQRLKECHKEINYYIPTLHPQ